MPAPNAQPRVVFVSSIFPSHLEPLRGLFCLRQLQGLRRRGWSFSVVAPVFAFPLLRSRFGPPAAAVARSETFDGFPTAHPRARYLPGSRGSLNATLYEWTVRNSVHRACASHSPGLLWSAFAFPDGVAVARMARRLGLPHVVSVLGSDLNLGLRLARRKRVIVQALRSARLVFAKSRALRDLIVAQGIGAEKVAVVYNGVDRSMFRFRPREEAEAVLEERRTRRVLFVGGLVPVKAVDVLLRAFAALTREKCDGLELVLVGAGHQEGSLRSLARRLGVYGSTRFLGPRDPQNVALWMNASDILCLPSLREGVPNVVLEAFSSGCPVVASRVGGIPEVHAGESVGAMVEPGDPDRLAEALRAALAREWDHRSISASMDGWSWERNAQLVEEAARAARLLD